MRSQRADKACLESRRQSDTKTGTYIVVVSEPMHDMSGNFLSDDGIDVNALGHKKLGGTGQYVRHQLLKRLKRDPEVTACMKTEGLLRK